MIDKLLELLLPVFIALDKAQPKPTQKEELK
jgi:hypothetical protein